MFPFTEPQFFAPVHSNPLQIISIIFHHSVCSCQSKSGRGGGLPPCHPHDFDRGLCDHTEDYDNSNSFCHDSDITNDRITDRCGGFYSERSWQGRDAARQTFSPSTFLRSFEGVGCRIQNEMCIIATNVSYLGHVNIYLNNIPLFPMGFSQFLFINTILDIINMHSCHV